jgi:two-component system CheB/CheR fusion protein
MTLHAPDTAFETLLEYLKRTRGFDFTGYKRGGLARRFQKQMQTLGLEDYGDYLDYLEVHHAEFDALFNAILINVTAFFRDTPAWDYLAAEVVPTLLESKESNSPIRAWVAGCASGEEAYTLAMVLAEAMGIEQFRERVKIYATDVDEDALSHARHATYGTREVAGVPSPLLEKYFEHTDRHYVFHREMRRNVIFGRNDLVQDAPISRVDLLTCRNTLMYLNSEVQARILSRFHFALNAGGILFLGKAEMLFSHAPLFQPHNLKWRVFQKVPRRGLPGRLPLTGRYEMNEAPPETSRQLRIREMVFDNGSVAQIVIDLGGQLSQVNDRARGLFRISSLDLGRPFQDLELSYQPTELRSLIERVMTERRPVSVKEVRWPTNSGEMRYLDVLVMPLMDSLNQILSISITFADVTRFKQLQMELETTHRELEASYEELQSSNEELETTNEELQSINEELETTNEELQSSNEEMETMNEELNSSNEELQTVNTEMERRTAEVDHLNGFLSSILTSLRGGVVVVNTDLEIQVWSEKAEDLWGLRTEEVMGRHFLNLDIGLPVDQLRPSIRACLSGDSTEEKAVLDATNRRGKTITCHTTCTPLLNSQGDIRGVILIMEEQEAIVRTRDSQKV